MNPPSTPTTPLTPPSTQTEGSSTLARSNPPGKSILPGCRQRELKTSKPMQVNTGVDWHAVVSNQRREENSTFSPDKRRKFNGNGIYVPHSHDLGPDNPFSPRAPFLPRPGAPCPRGSFPVSRINRVSGSPQVHDPSLTLPPLRATPSPRQDQGDVGTMVMAIPFINKIKTLAMVSPPLASNRRCRGAVVSIEGQDSEAVKCVVRYMNETFEKSQVVREFEGPKSASQQSELGGTGDTTEQYLQYHRTISSWLNISGEIVDFMNRDSVKIESACGGYSAPTEPKTAATQVAVADRDATANEASEEPIRIALISRYQLTTTDSHACMTPIRDSYGPMDHWQWMASLWRGCVGPDITVVIRDCEQEEIEKFGGGNPVENRLDDAMTLVVRRAAGSSGSIEEKALRRVGFEVEEFLRR